MVARRRVAAIAKGCLAVVAVLALLVTPVTASTGAQVPHAHALIHLLIDGADGSFDHHHIGNEHADAGGAHAGAAGNAVFAVRAESHDPVAMPIRSHQAADAALADDAGDRAALPDDFPVVTSLSVFATAAATPVADVLARLLAPAVATLVLAWGPPREMAGIVLRPTSPPPQAAFGS